MLRRIAASGESRDEQFADLLSTLVTGREDRPDVIRDDDAGLLIAGHETSAAALTWAFAALAPRPDLSKRSGLKSSPHAEPGASHCAT